MKLLPVLFVLLGLALAQDRLVDRLVSGGAAQKAAVIDDQGRIYMKTDNFQLSDAEAADFNNRFGNLDQLGNSITFEGENYIIHNNRDPTFTARKGTDGRNSRNGDAVVAAKANGYYILIVCPEGEDADVCRAIAGAASGQLGA